MKTIIIWILNYHKPRHRVYSNVISGFSKSYNRFSDLNVLPSLTIEKSSTLIETLAFLSCTRGHQKQVSKASKNKIIEGLSRISIQGKNFDGVA